jgi:hypothetical protein
LLWLVSVGEGGYERGEWRVVEGEGETYVGTCGWEGVGGVDFLHFFGHSVEWCGGEWTVGKAGGKNRTS